MSEAKEYPVRNLLEMARVPEADVARMYAELPHLVDVIRPFVQMYDKVRESGVDIPDSTYESLVQRAIWIDDDKGVAEVNISVRDKNDKERANFFSSYDIPRP